MQPTDVRPPKPAEIIPILFTAAEIEEAKRLFLKELEQRGCAADPAVTSMLFKFAGVVDG